MSSYGDFYWSKFNQHCSFSDGYPWTTTSTSYILDDMCTWRGQSKHFTDQWPNSVLTVLFKFFDYIMALQDWTVHLGYEIGQSYLAPSKKLQMLILLYIHTHTNMFDYTCIYVCVYSMYVYVFMYMYTKWKDTYIHTYTEKSKKQVIHVKICNCILW